MDYAGAQLKFQNHFERQITQMANCAVRGPRPVTSSQDRLIHPDYAYAPESS